MAITFQFRATSHHQDYDPATGSVTNSYAFTPEPPPHDNEVGSYLNLFVAADQDIKVGVVYTLTLEEVGPTP